MKLRAIDVCAGAGGWACAAKGLPIEIVAAFDREPDCLATYRLNHPGTECIRCDVTLHDFSPWRGIDLILGGIPCEQLSVARNNSPRSRLEMATIKSLVKKFLSLPGELGAAHWCYEDVLQLEALLPPGIPRFKLSSESFSAQARNRLFIGNCPAPKPGVNHSLLGDVLRRGPYRLSPRIFEKRLPSVSGKCSTTFQPWFPERKGLTVITLSSRRDAEAAAPHPLGWRQLEWQEGAALQGFPPDYLFIGNPGRVAKMIAQAVQIDAAREILKTLLTAIGEDCKVTVRIKKPRK